MMDEKNVNWDQFPEPFDKELPFYIDKAIRARSWPFIFARHLLKPGS
jgi:hypothetical protein